MNLYDDPYGNSMITNLVLRTLANRPEKRPASSYGQPATILVLSGLGAAQQSNFSSYYFRSYSMGTILLIILILFLVGALPSWPHSRNWGYGPSGLTGLVVIILLVLLLTGRI
jgi:hypothetical protein